MPNPRRPLSILGRGTKYLFCTQTKVSSISKSYFAPCAAGLFWILSALTSSKKDALRQVSALRKSVLHELSKARSMTSPRTCSVASQKTLGSSKKTFCCVSRDPHSVLPQLGKLPSDSWEGGGCRESGRKHGHQSKWCCRGATTRSRTSWKVLLLLDDFQVASP